MLSEYNFEICHIKGTSNGRADALSQRPDYDQRHEDNQNVTVLPEQVFARAMEVLPNHTTQEESTLKPWIDPHQLKQHQGIWYKDGRQVVTGDMEAKHHLFFFFFFEPIYIPVYKPMAKPGRNYEPLHFTRRVKLRGGPQPMFESTQS
jgi:hypothetical protein